jgi:hypothetical protein
VPGRGAIGLPLGEPLPGRVRGLSVAGAALVRIRLRGTWLREALLLDARLSGAGLAEPRLCEALLSRPRLFLARSRRLARTLPAGGELSRLVLTLTGSSALSLA